MRHTSFKGALVAMLVAAAVGLSAAACGGGSDDGNGGEPTKAPAATSAATSASGTEPASNGGAASTIDLVAKNTLWDKTELEAKAGKVTFNVDNQDAGLVHNLHIYKGKDADGTDLGATELEAGPVKQKLELELEAGEHFFTCDAHPATMSGKLEVE
ncbi:MAG: cupredoxin domain-containing protein [Chloroflexi bacterium]|nr:cupredoxin domain-containing protein [Chloroflexota bacterium]